MKRSILFAVLAGFFALSLGCGSGSPTKVAPAPSPGKDALSKDGPPAPPPLPGLPKKD